jgi:prepilin-type N-terminal cleavage/methylation domain-containing protein
MPRSTADNLARRRSAFDAPQPQRHAFRVFGTAEGRATRAVAAGFTLMELVLVLMILSIFLAVAVPQLRGFMRGSAARDAATQVVALAQYARAKAASDAVVYRLSFDTAAGEYRLTRDAGDGTGDFVELGTDFGQAYTLPIGMTVSLERSNAAIRTSPTATDADIEFRPDGTSDPAVIRLTDSNGNETLIASPSPTEPFRVTTAQEVDEL